MSEAEGTGGTGLGRENLRTGCSCNTVSAHAMGSSGTTLPLDS